MSLACGNCRQIIYDGFGMLYLLEHRKNGKLVHPHEVRKGMPNSAICDECWAHLPETEKLKGDAIRAEMDAGTDPVYIFLNADSGRGFSLFGSAKQWSSIETDAETTVFVRTPLVMKHFASAVEIIDRMAIGLKANRRRRTKN